MRVSSMQWLLDGVDGEFRQFTTVDHSAFAVKPSRHTMAYAATYGLRLCGVIQLTSESRQSSVRYEPVWGPLHAFPFNLKKCKYTPAPRATSPPPLLKNGP